MHFAKQNLSILEYLGLCFNLDSLMFIIESELISSDSLLVWFTASLIHCQSDSPPVWFPASLIPCES